MGAGGDELAARIYIFFGNIGIWAVSPHAGALAPSRIHVHPSLSATTRQRRYFPKRRTSSYCLLPPN